MQGPLASNAVMRYYLRALGPNAYRQWPDRDWCSVEPALELLWKRNQWGRAWESVRDLVRRSWQDERKRSLLAQHGDAR